MTSTDGVLAAIDSCLADYSIGPDAMRWAPNAEQPTHFTLGLPIMGEYIVSDGETTATMPPPPAAPGVYIAIMGEPGSPPRWQPLGYITADGIDLDLGDTNSGRILERQRAWAAWAEELSTAYPVVPVVSIYWAERRRAVKSEYARRRRNRR